MKIIGGRVILINRFAQKWRRIEAKVLDGVKELLRDYIV